MPSSATLWCEATCARRRQGADFPAIESPSSPSKNINNAFRQSIVTVPRSTWRSRRGGILLVLCYASATLATLAVRIGTARGACTPRERRGTTECIKNTQPITLPASMRAGDPGLADSASDTARRICNYYRSIATCYTACACNEHAVRAKFFDVNKTVNSYFLGAAGDYGHEGAGACPVQCGTGSTADPSLTFALVFAVAAKLLML